MSAQIPHASDTLLARARRAIASHPNVFFSRGKLVEVVPDRDHARLLPLRWSRISSLLGTDAEWQGYLAQSAEGRCPPWLPTHLLQSETWPEARRLAGVTDVPVLRPDGTLLTAPGYDEATGLYYAPAQAWPEVPAAPTRDDALAATRELEEIVELFPVMSRSHRSSLLAALLTPFAAIDGDRPLFLFDSPTDSCGAAEAAELLGLLASGRRIRRFEPAASERAFRRQLARLPAPEANVLLLDGCSEFRAPTAFRTALRDLPWVDGGAGGGDVRRHLTWYAVTTNCVLGREAADLVLPIRLFDTSDHALGPTYELPPHLDRWLLEHRPRFVRAALTLLRGYIAAGRPVTPTTSWPRFRAWSDLIVQSLLWVGQPDALLARRANRAAIGDDEATGLRSVVIELSQLLPANTGLTTAEILREMHQDSGAAQACRRAFVQMLGTEQLTTRNVGNLLRAQRDRCVEGHSIHRLGSARSGFARWTIERNPLAVAAATVTRPPQPWDAPVGAVMFSEGAVVLPADHPAAPIDPVGDYEVVRRPPVFVGVGEVPSPRARRLARPSPSEGEGDRGTADGLELEAIAASLAPSPSEGEGRPRTSNESVRARGEGTTTTSTMPPSDGDSGDSGRPDFADPRVEALLRAGREQLRQRRANADVDPEVLTHRAAWAGDHYRPPRPR